MNLRHATTEAVARPNVRGEAATRLRGRWLIIARVAWVVTAMLSAGLFVARLPAHYARLLTLSRADMRNPDAVRAGLAYLGLSPGVYAAFTVALTAVFTLVFFVVAMVLFWRKSDEGMALFVALWLVTFGATFPFGLDLLEGHTVSDMLARSISFLSWILFFTFFYLFPDGRFVPGWTSMLAVVWVAREIARFYFPDSPFSPWTWPPLVRGLEALGSASTCVLAQIYRYRQVSTRAQRQQTKWVVFGMTVAVAGFFAFALPNLFIPSLDRPGSIYDLAVPTAMLLCFLLIPLTLAIAILRYRLWDIDVLINRALVYGVLTATLVLVYVGSVVGLQQFFRRFTGQTSQLAVVGSTLAIAALFQPLRRRIQAFIDRRFYRRKYDAVRTLAAFSAKLREQVDLETLTGDLLAVVEDAMQPAHVSLWLRDVPASEPRDDSATHRPDLP